MDIHDLLNRLDGVKANGTNKWMAHCPCIQNHAHGDKNPSLSVALGDKAILMHCHTGCKLEDICGAIGIEPKDLFYDAPMTAEQTIDERRQSFIEWWSKEKGYQFLKAYSYCYDGYEDDGLMKVRFLDAEGKKTFRWISNEPTRDSGFKWSHDGCEHRLYVAGDLDAEEVFVVEGEKDADTLHSITGKTVVSAENGAQKKGDGSKWRPEYTDQLAGKTVVILNDNDPIGRDFACIEADAIATKAKSVRLLDITTAWKECPEKGDISDMVEMLGKQETLTRLQRLLQTAPEWLITLDLPSGEKIPVSTAATPREEPEPMPEETGADMVDSFLDEVQTERYKPIPTGIPEVDRALDGGFTRKTLVMFGAAPGMGKTIFCQWALENMAKDGTDVLYLNLEMDRSQLLARSMSRLVWQTSGWDVSSLQIMRGYQWDAATKSKVQKAATAYKETIAPHLTYNPKGTSNKISEVLEIMTKHAKEAKAAGKDAPIICLDYLQLIDPEEKGDPIEGMKNVIKKLKNFAMEYNTVILAIMANNRTSNKAGAADIDSGRDTSAIEYSGDLMLGLVYTAVEDKEQYTPKVGSDPVKVTPEVIRTLKKEAHDNNQPIPEICNRVSLKVNKNRFGEDIRRVKLIFDGKHSIFKIENGIDTSMRGFKRVKDTIPF